MLKLKIPLTQKRTINNYLLYAIFMKKKRYNYMKCTHKMYYSSKMIFVIFLSKIRSINFFNKFLFFLFVRTYKEKLVTLTKCACLFEEKILVDFTWTTNSMVVE